MQTTPQQTKTPASKAASPPAEHAPVPEVRKPATTPKAVELEPHLEELCDMATD